MIEFQSESTLNSHLNFKELLARNRRDISSLSNSDRILMWMQVIHEV